MFNKILIANRGEIAVRIIRACKELDIKTVAVYSEIDKDSLHVKLADEAICIGPWNSLDSYLNIKNILSACVLTGAEAIHPGFGFLSENSKFAKMCEECNIKFIGPSYKTIDLMGNKANARMIMKKTGIPVIPGYEGKIESIDSALSIAKDIGFPLMIKAAAGGGGKGIRIVREIKDFEENYEGKIESIDSALSIAKDIGFPLMIKAAAGGGGKGIRIVREIKDFEENYNQAKVEAKVSFSDDTMYIEKFIENPKHIEIQIVADEFGNYLYLFERDCSIQRKNQKVIEEAPSLVLDEDLRREMGNMAISAAKAVSYKNVGTIEFLVDKNNQKVIEEAPSLVLDEDLRREMGNMAISAAKAVSYKNVGTIEFLVDKNNNFYFMEMNTRIQVEHPITEMITGIDLLKEQIKIASGQKLSITQDKLTINGHSIECRINAEDTDRGFLPSPGTIDNIHFPGGNGIRIDSGVYSGYTIPHCYDSMIAKLIVHGRNRTEAIQKMKRALEEFDICGIKTNINYQLKILNNERFLKGDYTTSFLVSELVENK